MTHAFYPLVGVCRAPAYAARGRGQGLWCDGRRRELRPVNRRKGGLPSPPGDRQRCRFAVAWSKSERAVIVVREEGPRELPRAPR
jgi:hypothetical protein